MKPRGERPNHGHTASTVMGWLPHACGFACSITYTIQAGTDESGTQRMHVALFSALPFTCQLRVYLAWTQSMRSLTCVVNFNNINNSCII